MDFAREFVILFANLKAGTAILLIVGLALIVLEMFYPKFGIFAAIGVILYIVGMVLRVILKDGNILAQVFFMLFFASIVCLISFIVMLATVKKNWLYKNPLGKTNKINIPIGTKGHALEELTPIGKVQLNDEEVVVSTEGFTIEKGEEVVVVAIEDNIIIVDRE